MASFAAWRRDGPTVDTIAWLLDLFIADRQLEIEFLDSGVGAFAFTFA